MNTAAVTIAGPDRRVDLVVSTETTIADLIPTFVELSVDDAPNGDGRGPVWSVAPPGHQPLPLDRTLAQCGVADGTVLTLTELRSQAMAPPSPAAADAALARAAAHGTPRERAQLALPEALGGRARVSAVDQGVLRLRGRGADRRVGRAAGAEQPRGAHQGRAPRAERARARRLARLGLPRPARPRDRGAAAEPLRDDRRRLAEGRRRQDHADGAARLAARPRAARPHRRRRHQPGLRLARAHADARPPDLRGRPGRDPRAARPRRSPRSTASSAARSRA